MKETKQPIRLIWCLHVNNAFMWTLPSCEQQGLALESSHEGSVHWTLPSRELSRASPGSQQWLTEVTRVWEQWLTTLALQACSTANGLEQWLHLSGLTQWQRAKCTWWSLPRCDSAERTKRTETPRTILNTISRVSSTSDAKYTAHHIHNGFPQAPIIKGFRIHSLWHFLSMS